MSSESGLGSGGTISGDVTISGDLTVQGSSTSATYDEIIQGGLHVQTSDVSFTPENFANDLVVEGTGATGITIGTNTNQDKYLVFGDYGDSDKAWIKVSSGNVMSFKINGTERFFLDTNSRISLSNNDAGGTGGSDSISGNTVFGYNAGNQGGALMEDGSHDNTLIGHYALGGGTKANATLNVAVGANALKAGTSATSNVAIGHNAMTANAAGGYSVAIGRDALLAINDDANDGSVAIGFLALSSQAATGTQWTSPNTAVGHMAGAYLKGETGGSDHFAIQNTLLGFRAGANGETDDLVENQASDNVLIGHTVMGANYGAGVSHFIADKNIGIGTAVLKNNLAGTENVAIGYLAMEAADNTETRNVVIGSRSGASINSDSTADNVILGYAAGQGGSGEMIGNIAIGTNALNATAATAQAGNIAIGYDALTLQDTATVVGIGDVSNPNIAIGYQAGKRITSGDSNVLIGHLAHGKAAGDGRGDDNVYIGARSGYTATDADSNVAIGRDSLYSTVAGAFNVAIGHSALYTANENDNDGTVAIGYEACKVQAGTGGAQFASATVGIGYKALTALTTGVGNTAVGYNAGLAITTATQNTAIGYEALKASVDGLQNTAVGYQSLYACNLGAGDEQANVAIGREAGYGIVTGKFNVCIGNKTMQSAAHADTDSNVAIGHQSMKGGTDAGFVNNVGVGSETLFSITGGDYNSAIGSKAGYALTTGSYNVHLGYQAGEAQTIASSNTFIGGRAGADITQGENNVSIGRDSLYVSTTSADQVCIGAWAGSLIYGSQSVAIGKDALKGTSFTQGSCSYNNDPTITHGSNVNIIAGLGVQGTGIPDGAYISSITDGTHFELSASTTGGSLSSQTLTFYSRVSGTIAIGYDALTSIKNGTNNNAIGYLVGTAVTTGSRNVMYGTQAGEKITTGSENVLIGNSAGAGLTTTSNNTYVGHAVAANASSTGHSNTLVGSAAGAGAVLTGNYNSSLGRNSLLALTSGDDNVAIGYEAGDTVTTGEHNVLIGKGADITVGSYDNCIVLGRDVTANNSNQIIIGGRQDHDFIFLGGSKAHVFATDLSLSAGASMTITLSMGSGQTWISGTMHIVAASSSNESGGVYQVAFSAFMKNGSTTADVTQTVLHSDRGEASANQIELNAPSAGTSNIAWVLDNDHSEAMNRVNIWVEVIGSFGGVRYMSLATS